MLRTLSRTLLLGLTLLAFPASALAASDDPLPTIPLDEVQTNTDCRMLTVLHGLDISSVDVHIKDIMNDPAQPLIYAQITDPEIAKYGPVQGMSGSPILCPKTGGGEGVIGALAYGYDAPGNSDFMATPIQSMLGQEVTLPSSIMSSSSRRVDRKKLIPLTALSLSGVPRSAQPGLQKLAEKMKLGAVRFAPRVGTRALAPVSERMAPGGSVGVPLVWGDIAMGGYGTVTYRDGNSFWAFGHPMENLGPRSMPISSAYIYGLYQSSDSYSPAFKLGSITNENPFGTLTFDNPFAVGGAIGQTAPRVPVTVSVQKGSGTPVVKRAYVADEFALGQPGWNEAPAWPAAYATAALGALANDANTGTPPRQYGNTCVSATVAGFAKSIDICADFATSTSGPEGNGANFITPMLSSLIYQTATRLAWKDLHITALNVTTRINDGVGYYLVREVSAPKTVKRGTRLPVTVSFSKPDGSEASRTFQVAIPRSAKLGSTTAVVGSQPFYAGAFFNMGLGALMNLQDPSDAFGTEGPLADEAEVQGFARRLQRRPQIQVTPGETGEGQELNASFSPGSLGIVAGARSFSVKIVR